MDLANIESYTNATEPNLNRNVLFYLSRLFISERPSTLAYEDDHFQNTVKSGKGTNHSADI